MDEQHDQAVGAGSPILHLRCPRDVDPELYRLLLGLMADVTPVVQALPPSAAMADVSGRVRFFDRDPTGRKFKGAVATLLVKGCVSSSARCPRRFSRCGPPCRTLWRRRRSASVVVVEDLDAA